jgi:membrane fusion protein, copper/silver efflux system
VKNATLSALLLGALVAAFLAGAWFNQRQSVSAAGSRPRKIVAYVDPMHPAYKSDKPGTAPDCGMPLEPIYEDDRPPEAREVPRSPMTAGAANITPERQLLAGVRVSAVEKVADIVKLRLYGRVAPDERRLYPINVGIDGFVREISPVTTGSLVEKDQWLATLSASEIRAPLQAYVVALDVLDRTRNAGEGAMRVELATAALQQTMDRLLTFGMSSVQLEEIGRTRQVPSTIRITAPAAGFLVARHASIGQKLGKGEELYRIADLRRVWVLADVIGADAKYVKAGASAEVSVPGLATPLRARVSSDVRPQFDAGSQSVKLRLEVDNPGFVLRPEMLVDVDMLVTLPPSIAVPVDAVLDSGLKKTVFVERSAGVFEPRQVETGWRFGQRVQIVAGLAAGDRVVVAGTFFLDAENRLRTARSAGSLR